MSSAGNVHQPILCEHRMFRYHRPMKQPRILAAFFFPFGHCFAYHAYSGMNYAYLDCSPRLIVEKAAAMIAASRYRSRFLPEE
jgi:hypothetical protein